MNVNSYLMIHQYRNVVYLNNAAATFMARGDYRQAITSFKDALFLLETIVRPVASSVLKASPTQDINFPRDINDMFLHLSTPYVLDTQIKINRVAQQLASGKKTNTNCFLKIEVICYDGSIDSSFSMVEQQQKFRSEQNVVAIQISDLLVDSKMDKDEMYVNITEIVPAIILSNYALAHFCLFKATDNYYALNGAIRLFHMSMKVLCIRDKMQHSLFYNSNADHEDRFMFFTEGSMFVSLAISLNVQCIPFEAAVKCCSVSAFSSHIIQDEFSCSILQDLTTLQKFSGEWIMSTSYQVTIAICKVSSYGINTATAA